MTDAFEDRKKGFEAKFRQDTELAFKTGVRRDKLLGLWAAQQLGLSGPAAEAYAKKLVSLALDHPGDDAVITTVLSDMTKAHIPMTEGRLRIKLEKFGAEAHDQIYKAAEPRKRLS